MSARRLARDIAAAPSSTAAWEILSRRTDADQIHVAACLNRAAKQPLPPSLLAQLLRRLRPSEMDAETLFLNVWALAKLDAAAAEWHHLLCDAERRRAELSARHLANLLWATARAKESSKVLTELPRCLPDMSTQGLSNCFWALSKFALRHAESLELLSKEAEARVNELTLGTERSYSHT